MDRYYTAPNHPLVVWASWFLWIISIFAILWSLLLFFCVGDILLITGTDKVNAVLLLSGIIMLPTNLRILWSIAYGRPIDHKSKVFCCPMWLCILWIIVVNCLGAGCCIQRMCHGKHLTVGTVNKTMKYYRNVPKYKHFVDNMQWSLKCCGIDSYKDWFDRDWYDKIRDYEWDPSVVRRRGRRKKVTVVTDSVPLSCCKSGSCISNYLLELGVHSINTKGCGDLICRIIFISMLAHFVLFLSVILAELLILKLLMDADSKHSVTTCQKHIKHIMSVNNCFNNSTNSIELNPDDTDYENEAHHEKVLLMDGTQSRKKKRGNINDEDSESP